MTTTRPRPVLNAALVSGVIKAVVLVLTFLSFNDAADWLNGETTAIVSVAVGLFALGGDILAALHSQGKVTPLADPKAASGAPLVEASSAVLQPLVIGGGAGGSSIGAATANIIYGDTAKHAADEPIDVGEMPA